VSKIKNLWQAETERPRHHVVSLFPNYPPESGHDHGHLILTITQRTTGAGRGIRLSRRALVDLASWLLAEPETLAQEVHLVAQVRAASLVDLLVASRRTDGVLLVVTHRAADYPQTAMGLVDGSQAAGLAEAIVAWDAQQPGGPAADLARFRR
jgi:hypothetical protein